MKNLRRQKRLLGLLITLILFPSHIFSTVGFAANNALIEELDAAYFDGESIYKTVALAAMLFILARMGRSLFNSAQRDWDIEDDELEYLARVIHGEARGEPFIGQIAVGAVVLNRVHDPRFPDNVREVILAERQFTCVADGQFYLQPDESAYRAALQALSGDDPTGGALYFYNPKTARNMNWFRQLRFVCQIGNHIFATDP